MKYEILIASALLIVVPSIINSFFGVISFGELFTILSIIFGAVSICFFIDGIDKK